MTILLQLNEVSKAYGALKAVDTVSLAVEDGEALAVIGPNGAGKTTLVQFDHRRRCADEGTRCCSPAPT